MRRYFSSEKNFLQYRPPKNKWQEFWESRKKNKRTVSATNKTKEISPRGNPFRREEKRKFSIPLWIKLFFPLFLFFSWIILIIYLPYFRINKITYYGLRIIKREEIDNYIKINYLENWQIIPKNNYFVASIDEISKLLNEKYALNQLVIKKNFPSGLTIDLQEKMTSVIYDNGSKYFLLDSDGNVVNFLRDTGDVVPTSTLLVASSTELISTSTIYHKPDYLHIKNDFGDYPLIFDFRYLPITEKQNNILSKNIIATVIAWQEMVEKQGRVTIKYFVMDNPEAGLGAVVNKGFTIYWQPTHELLAQLNSLETVLKEVQPKEYIDLRFGERIYWK